MRKSSPICEIIVITQCLWHQILEVNISRFSKAGYDYARAWFDTFWKIYFNRLNTFHMLHFTNWNLDFKQSFLHSHKINLIKKILSFFVMAGLNIKQPHFLKIFPVKILDVQVSRDSSFWHPLSLWSSSRKESFTVIIFTTFILYSPSPTKVIGSKKYSIM